MTVVQYLGRTGSGMFKFMRRSPGFSSAMYFSLFLGVGTYIIGPEIESKYVRYALAGTIGTVAVEFITHPIDSINMRSKVINGNKLYVPKFLYLQGFTRLFLGINAVIYGYTLSSMVYFYSYIKFKEKFNHVSFHFNITIVMN
jgi:hypothetical protein